MTNKVHHVIAKTNAEDVMSGTMETTLIAESDRASTFRVTTCRTNSRKITTGRAWNESAVQNAAHVIANHITHVTALRMAAAILRNIALGTSIPCTGR